MSEESKASIADQDRLTRRPGLDHRPARRHPRVLRAAARRLGGARRAVAGRRPRRRRGRPAGARQTFDTGHPPLVPPRTAERPRIAVSPHPPAGLRRARWPRRSAPTWSRWARPAPRSSRWSATSATPTCTPAGSTSGTPPRRSPWPGPPACTRAASTAPRWSTTSPRCWLPDLVVCRPELADAILDYIDAARRRVTRHPTRAARRRRRAPARARGVGGVDAAGRSGHLSTTSTGSWPRRSRRSGPRCAGRARWLDVLPGLLERWGIPDCYDDAGLSVWLTIEPVAGTAGLVRVPARARHPLLPGDQPGRAPRRGTCTRPSATPICFDATLLLLRARAWPSPTPPTSRRSWTGSVSPADEMLFVDDSRRQRRGGPIASGCSPSTVVHTDDGQPALRRPPRPARPARLRATRRARRGLLARRARRGPPTPAAG